MKFLLLCCTEENRWLKLPESQRDTIMEQYGKVLRDLQHQGRLLGGAKLDGTASAVTVREKNGKPVITDGPFAETKEQLGGYHVIECQDRDEAISIASRFPTLAAGGSFEVRPYFERNDARSPEINMPPKKKQARGQDERGFPAGLAAPARRALVAAGYTRLNQLQGVSEAELMQLHGMGPKTMDQIRRALRGAGRIK